MASIKRQILLGSFFNGLAKYLTMFCNIVVTAVLSRIISPSDFGIVAITAVVASFFDLLSDAGFGPAIIQSKDIDKDEHSNIFTYSGLFAVFLALLFFALSVPVSRIYDEARLIPILKLLSIQLFFNSYCVLPRALMLKKKQFKKIAIVSVCNVIFWGGCSIVAAKCGLGIYSLLITPIGTSISCFLSYYLLCGERLHITVHPSFSSIQKLLSFSLFQFGFNCINFFSRNLDKLLIGKKIGMDGLGYYEKSYRMMTLPLSSLTQVFAPTIQPILSEYDTQKSIIAGVYYKMTKYLLAVGSIIAPLLFFCSEELILIVFGDQWMNAVPIFRILSISVVFQLLDSMSGAFLQASNAPRYLFVSGAICAIINISFLIFGLVFFGDLKHVAIFVSAAFCLNLWVSVFYIVMKIFRQSVGSYLKLFVKPFILIAIISVVLRSVSLFLVEMPIVPLFIIKSCIAASIGLLYYARLDYIDISIKSLIR